MTQSTYLETLAPRNCSPHTLFVYPYVEAKRNFIRGTQSEQTIPLDERIAHVVLAIFLFIPIINTLLFLALRETCTVSVSRSPLFEPLETEAVAPAVVAQINTLNTQRNELVAAQQLEHEGSSTRASYTQKIKTVEWQAASLVPKLYSETVAAHLRRSARLSQSITECDGILNYRHSRTLRYKNGTRVTFRPIAGLSQQSGSNQLCGHYALFFMLQAVNKKSPLDRKAFNQIIGEWSELLATKRIADYLGTHHYQNMPFGLRNVSISGISPGEIKFLIQKSKFTEPLRNNEQCFYMDLEEILDPRDFAKPVSPLSETGKIAKTFPLYFILKAGGHYYFCHAKTPSEFTMMDSMGYGVAFDPDSLNRFVQQVALLTSQSSDKI